jgi:hypothetical protein
LGDVSSMTAWWPQTLAGHGHLETGALKVAEGPGLG